jgi:hypothetical protein
MRDVQDQLKRYWSSVTDEYPAPDAGKVLAARPINGAAPRHVTTDEQRVAAIPPTPEPDDRSRGGWVLAVAAAVIAVVAVGGMYIATRSTELAAGDDAIEATETATTTVVVEAEAETEEAAPTSVPTQPEVAETNTSALSSVAAVLPQDALGLQRQDVADATGGTPLPDIVGATLGDEGAGVSPLGVVTGLPEGAYLDFLYEFPCGEPDCWFRDAVFKDVNDPAMESGPFTSGTPFYVRHGFVNDAVEPLGDGFDVALYVFPMDQPGEYEGLANGVTVRYTSDYVIRGETDQCGPTYNSQTGAVSCEWFVHEFPEGLPDGRFALWAVWEAPCSAWVEMGFADACVDPDEVMSFFSSGVDSPFDEWDPEYVEINEAHL